MEVFQIIWDLPEEPEGNIQYVAEHDVTPEEVDEVLRSPTSRTDVTRTTGREITFGYTSEGRYIAVIWHRVIDDPLTVRPITAFEVPKPRGL